MNDQINTTKPENETADIIGETISREVLKELSVDDMLDLELDMVEDIVGFLLPPKGYYRLSIDECKVDIAGEKQVIKTSLRIMETIELVDTDDKPAPDEGTFDQTYFPGYGIGQFKTEYGPIARESGFTTFRDLIDGLGGMEINAYIGHRKDKNDKDKVYPTVSKITAI